MKKLISKEQVAAAIERLKADNKPATLANIRTVLGAGSLSTIQKLKDEIEGSQPPPEDEKSKEVFKNLWATAVAQGEAKNAAKVSELSGAIAFVDAENERIGSERDEALSRLKNLESTNAQLVRDLALSHDAAAAARTERDKAVEALTTAQENHRREAENLRAQLAAAEANRRDAEIKAARLEGELAARSRAK